MYLIIILPNTPPFTTRPTAMNSQKQRRLLITQDESKTAMLNTIFRHIIISKLKL
jgi:hypothetical protein